MKHFLMVLLTVASCCVLFTETGRSIPAFARKYQTSCATCHNGFPKLTAFGEAFRRNGYQFPGGTDAEFTKETPVSLGSEGNKKAFPDAIWPGTLPGSSPISLFLNGEVDYNPNVDPRFTFDGLGSSIEAVAAGTLGEDLSFWGHAILSNDGVELNRIFLIFSNIIGDNYAFNVRLGAFEPGLFSFSTHRAWMEGYWLTTRPFSNDMGWSIEEFQKGLEVNGMLQGRFGYSAGILEGFGSTHPQKDYYAHLTYKINGLPLDGVVEGGATPNNAQPYIDNSLTIGTFIYHGRASIGGGEVTSPATVDTTTSPPQVIDGVASSLPTFDNDFTMVGGDVNASYDRLNLFGGVGVRRDEHPFLDPMSTGLSAKTTVWFTELDVVAFPWLLPGLRYESWNSESADGAGGTLTYSDQQFVPGVVALVRPNVKMTLRTTIEKFDSRGDTKFDFGQFILGLAVGI
jgi:hypothetical protein